MTENKRDHGGGLDAAIAKYGGEKSDWLDLSTGINPIPFPLPELPMYAWTALPDQAAQIQLLNAARAFWNVPDGAEIVAASGVSTLISMLPNCAKPGGFHIQKPTYNEHEAAFRSAGFDLVKGARSQIYVHPNNPTGAFSDRQHVLAAHKDLTIIDESFCDATLDKSLIDLTCNDGFVVLKGLGKFWGLAGVRLGFAIAAPKLAAQIRDRIGPWAVSGPAQVIGAAALADLKWAEKTRVKNISEAVRLDKLLTQFGGKYAGGTDLFRLYDCDNAQAVFNLLAEHKILCRIFPYSDRWVRLGLPGTEDRWAQLEHALGA
jgi:cobalamin biosynthetic protein CobC